MKNRKEYEVPYTSSTPANRQIKFVADSTNFRYGIMQEGNPSSNPTLVNALKQQDKDNKR